MRLLTAGSLVRVQLGTVGVDDAGGPPVPIPNTEVKPCSAEDTWLATARKNRKMPTSDSEYSSFLAWQLWQDMVPCRPVEKSTGFFYLVNTFESIL